MSNESTAGSATHMVPVFMRSPHMWKHGGSNCSCSSLHTASKFGQCGEICWKEHGVLYVLAGGEIK